MMVSMMMMMVMMMIDNGDDDAFHSYHYIYIIPLKRITQCLLSY